MAIESHDIDENNEIKLDHPRLLILIKLFFWVYWIPKLGPWWYKLYMKRLVYRIEDDCLVCESGVFFYNKKRVPFEAIREASVYRGPLLQLISGSIVRVHTAGQNTGWPEISYLCPEDAEALVAQILHRARKAKRNTG